MKRSLLICVYCVFVPIFTGLGGTCRQTNSSVGHFGSVRALPPRYLPQCSEAGDFQVGFVWSGSIKSLIDNILIFFVGFIRSLGCSMDSLVFASSWRSLIVGAKLQVKVAWKPRQTHTYTRMYTSDVRQSTTKDLLKLIIKVDWNVHLANAVNWYQSFTLVHSRMRVTLPFFPDLDLCLLTS